MAKLLNKKLLTRILSAFFYLLIIALSFYNKYTFLVVFELVMLQCLWEFYAIISKKDVSPKKWFGLLFAALLFLSIFLFKNKYITIKYFYLLIAVFFSSFLIELLRKKTNTLHNLATEMLGILYIALPFSMINFFVFQGTEFEFEKLLAIFLIIWAYDVAAYFVGVSIGRKKIFKNISPKKTLEGTVGGIILAIIAGYFVLGYFGISEGVYRAILSMLITFGAFTGDLVESKIKRSVNVKDSGNIMPGHGGLLDRFDSFIFSVIFAFFFLAFGL